MRTIRVRATALFAIAIAVAGGVAALRAEVGGLAVLFGVLGAISAVGLRPNRGRQPVCLRPDLARWLEQVSAVTAEPVDTVLDRSVSAYRASVHRGADE